MLVEKIDGKTVVNVDAFIIPNVLDTIVEGASEWWEGKDRVANDFADFSSPIPESEMVNISWPRHEYKRDDGTVYSITEAGNARVPKKWIQIWLVDREKASVGEDSNVIRHGELIGIENLVHITENIPAYYFVGKKEGEIVEYVYKDVTFRLTLTQTKYRYARFGKFEDCFTHVTK